MNIVIETSVTTQQPVEHLPFISFVGGKTYAEENPAAWPRSSEYMACFLAEPTFWSCVCWFKLTMLAIWVSFYNFGCHASHENNLGWSFIQRMILLNDIDYREFGLFSPSEMGTCKTQPGFHWDF